MKKTAAKVSSVKQYKDIASWGNDFFVSKPIVGTFDQGFDLAATLSKEISKQLAGLRSQKVARR